MSRKTISLNESVYNDLNDAKGEDESFSDTVERLLSTADSPDGTGEQKMNTLTIDHIDDIANRTARKTADELENRQRRP